MSEEVLSAIYTKLNTIDDKIKTLEDIKYDVDIIKRRVFDIERDKWDDRSKFDKLFEQQEINHESLYDMLFALLSAKHIQKLVEIRQSKTNELVKQFEQLNKQYIDYVNEINKKHENSV